MQKYLLQPQQGKGREQVLSLGKENSAQAYTVAICSSHTNTWASVHWMQMM